MEAQGRRAGIREVAAEARREFERGVTLRLVWRTEQLAALLRLLEEREAELCDALALDLGKSPHEVFISEVNVDTFMLTGDTLRSVHQEVDEDEEMIFAYLYRELVQADTRNTRRQGCGQGVRVGCGKGLIVRGASTSAGRGTQTYMRRGSSSSDPIPFDTIPLPREPSFDDDGNPISEEEIVDALALDIEESSHDSLDHSSLDGIDDNGSSSSSSSSSHALASTPLFSPHLSSFILKPLSFLYPLSTSSACCTYEPRHMP